MASRRLAVPLAYPKRGAGPRSVTRIDRRSLILVVGLLTLVAFAGVLYLSQASVAAELRYRLASTEGEAQDLWQRNFALRLEIADRERLERVEERASRLGMIDAPTGDLYIACVVPPAGPELTAWPAAVVDSTRDVQGVDGAWARIACRLGWKADELATTRGLVPAADGQ